MGPPKHHHGQQDAPIGRAQEFRQHQLLPPIQHRLKGNHGGGAAHFFKRFAKALVQPPVPVPHGKQVVGHKPQAGHEGKAGPQPQSVAEAPEQLTHHLGMAADAQNSGGVETHPGFEQGRNFQEVKGGWIEEDETQGRQHPYGRRHAGHPLQIPQPQAVIAMGQEIGNQQHGHGQAGANEDQPPKPGAQVLFPPEPQGGATTVNDRKSQQQQQHHQAGVMHGDHLRENWEAWPGAVYPALAPVCL